MIEFRGERADIEATDEPGRQVGSHPMIHRSSSSTRRRRLS
ncbi:hypothetical protein [Tatumella ptyseos]|nr:hypothetical protein [Tatumella ptyseos]